MTEADKGALVRLAERLRAGEIPLPGRVEDDTGRAISVLRAKRVARKVGGAVLSQVRHQ